MNGFVIVDKPKGITSHDVVDEVRFYTSEQKVGHCGTLDPIATGVLVVALGEATKLTEYFLGCDKAYEVTALLGGVSDTYDALGKVEKFSDKKVPKSRIEDTLQVYFTGNISQVPPKYSALKIGGKKAYELARASKEFSLQPRRVRIENVEILDYEWPELKLRVSCGKGTYIRSLVHDLGQKLKCGAYMSELRRIRVAHFDISDAVSLGDLKLSFNEYLLPIKDVVSHLSRVSIDDREYARLKDGAIIPNNHGIMKDPVFAFYKGEIVGVLEFPQNGRLLKFRKKLNIF